MQVPRQPQPLYVLPGTWRGLVQSGNLDLLSRPVVQNPNGSISTVRTTSFGTPKGEVLLPTVINDKVVSPKAAYAHYINTGEHLGLFRNAAAATRYALSLHQQQEQLYAGVGQ